MDEIIVKIIVGLIFIAGGVITPLVLGTMLFNAYDSLTEESFIKRSHAAIIMRAIAVGVILGLSYLVGDFLSSS